MSVPAASTCCDRRPAGPSPTSAPVNSCPEKTPKTRVLFVDDEPAMLRVLKMGMRSMASVWDMDFVDGGEQALALIEQRPFDVVVTDMRMSGINGAQLLNQIMRQHPQTIRIILSGYSDLIEVVNCVGVTHQFLSKPCSLEELKQCIKRVTSMKSRLTNESLQRLTAGLRNLPSLPESYHQIQDALQSPTASTQRIAEIASQDPALSAQLLHLSNSAFFGFSCEVFTVTEAVQLLGVTVVQSLALSAPIFHTFQRERCPEFPLDQIWEHSLQTAMLARRFARDHAADAHMADHAFCASVLHDIGKIILANGLPEQYAAILKESRQSNIPLRELEQKHFGASHAEVGAYLLALWGLPVPLVEAVANHHQPTVCANNELCLAGIVHVANALQHAQVLQAPFTPSAVDHDYLQHLGLADQFENFREEMLSVRTE